jgi:PAS domain S-box-containing protein
MEELFFQHSTQKVSLKNGLKKTKEREKVLASFLEHSTTTLMAIRESSFFQNYLKNQKNTKLIEDIFLMYTKANQDFMQLRFIDVDGLEKIRVDRKEFGQKPYLIKNNNLQNKSNRYYFADSRTKELEKIWFSAIDLNVEHGEIEVPYKPTFRAVLPIKHDGKFGGILIINYLMENFISRYINAPLYNIMLFDDKGFTIHHYTHKENTSCKCWGNSVENGHHISKDFPNKYKQILSTKTLKTEQIVSKKFDLPIYGGLNILLKLNDTYIEEEKIRIQKQYITVACVIFILSLILTYIIIKFFSKTLLSLDYVTKISKELFQSEKKFKALLDYASDGIHILDEDGNLILYSHSFAKNLGYTYDEMKEMNVKEWDNYIPKDSLSTIIKEIIHNPKTFETKHIKKDGTIIDVQINAKSITLDGKQYLYSSQRDITEQNRLKNEIIQLNQELEQRVEEEVVKSLQLEKENFTYQKKAAMGDLIGIIAHQLKQPLNAISLSKDILILEFESGGVDIDYMDGYDEKITTQLDFMANSIDELRNFFRPNKNIQCASINTPIEKTLKILQNSITSKGIKIVKELEDDLRIKCIDSELQQVIINILTNAKDILMEKKIEDAFIKIKTQKEIIEEKEYVVLSIEDNGGGIPEEIIDKIFDSYFTTKGEAGTGIGLNLAKMIVEDSLSGNIRAENTNLGAKFYITLKGCE